MRLYYTEASPNQLKKARKHAPSHSHGTGWTPGRMTEHDVPYFLDNGAYTGSFDYDEWVAALRKAKTEMPTRPQFIVLPDVYGDAEATQELHREMEEYPRHDYDYEGWKKGALVNRDDWTRYGVLQPGLPLEEQFDGFWRIDGVFLGGPVRWKRAVGAQVAQMAHERDLKAHVGNPGGADGLVWAYKAGFDSLDTTTIFQNQYWHYLEKLEEATEETDPVESIDNQQSGLDNWSEGQVG